MIPRELVADVFRGGCRHIRRKVGSGQDNDVVVEAWECEECGDVLLAIADEAAAPPSKKVRV